MLHLLRVSVYGHRPDLHAAACWLEHSAKQTLAGSTLCSRTRLAACKEQGVTCSFLGRCIPLQNREQGMT